jgi:hypothetical protein
MSTNRKREILDLLESGKINAEEAAKMLNEVAAGSAEDAEAVEAQTGSTKLATKTSGGNGPSMFRVRVRNLETGDSKVSVNIPLRMLKFGLKLGGRFSPELEGFDINEINEMMTDMEIGMLVEVENEESNEHVQVYVE